MVERTIHSKYLFRQKELKGNFTRPVIVGCHIKTPENIGSIIRLADNIGCVKVLFIHEGEEIRVSKIKKTASSSFNKVQWRFCNLAEITSEIPENYKKVALETTSDSQNIFRSDLPQKIAFFVGNEITGIDPAILNHCGQIVHIPMPGHNTSMNVSHALSVALFEWYRQTI